MPNQTWKANERKLASLLGGERVPITGRQRGDAPDIKHDIWSIEAKHRKTLPSWLFNAMSQAIASIRGDQTPIVILHEKNQRHDNDFVVMRLKDFIDLHGDLPKIEAKEHDIEKCDSMGTCGYCHWCNEQHPTSKHPYPKEREPIR